jgi:O-antigen/teichoic acid export membrane protein
MLVNPIGQHINRHTHIWWEEGTLLARLKSYATYVALISLVGAALALVTGANLVTALVMLLMVVGITWNTTLVPMLNMLGLRRTAVTLGVLTSVACLGISLAVVSAAPSATGWLAGQAAGFAIGAVAAMVFLGRAAGSTLYRLPTLPVITKSEVLHYSLPLAIATGLMWVQLNGYRFLVEHYWSLAFLGFTAVGLGLSAQCWSLVETVAQQLLLPPFYRRIASADGDGNTEAGEQSLSDYLNVIGPVYLVIAGTVFLGARAMTGLLVDPRYASASYFLQLGALTECCRALAAAFGNAAQVTKRTDTLYAPYLAGAVITLGGVAVVGKEVTDIRWIGLPMLVGAIVMLVVMAVRMRSEVHYTLRPWPWAAAALASGAAGALALKMPWQVASASEAGLSLLALGLASSAVIGAILFRSAAMTRSLAVLLRTPSL